MRRSLLAFASWMLLVGVPAHADVLILGVDQSIEVQSNLFRTPVLEVQDGSYEIRPTVQLQRRAGRLTYDVRYAPAFDVYFSNSQLNGVDHFARGEVAYAPIPTGSLSLSADFANYRSIRSTSVDVPGGIPDVVPGEPSRVTRALGSLEYSQRIQPTLLAYGRANVESYSFTSSNNVDNVGFGAETGFLHEMRSNLALGGFLFASHRRFAQTGTVPESRNVVLNGSFALQAEPIQTLIVELQGGPALIYTRQDTLGPATVDRYFGLDTNSGTAAAVFDTNPASPTPCVEFAGQPLLAGCPLGPAPALAGQLDQQVLVDFDPGQRPPGSDENQWTGFLRASVRKDDSWGSVGLDFSRWEEPSAGISSTTIRDSLTGTLVLRPGRWSVRLRGNWNQRRATVRTDQSLVRAGPSAVATGTGLFYAEANGLVPNVVNARSEITQYWADATAVRPLWDDRLLLELRFRYLLQDRTEGVDAIRTRFDNYSGMIRLRYEFRPLHYWD